MKELVCVKFSYDEFYDEKKKLQRYTLNQDRKRVLGDGYEIAVKNMCIKRFRETCRLVRVQYRLDGVEYEKDHISVYVQPHGREHALEMFRALFGSHAVTQTSSW